MTQDTCFLTIAEAAERIAARDISPVDLTKAYLDRIAAIDPQLNAFITLTADHAMKLARKAEAEIAKGDYRGPLHGVPFALKDMFDTAGILTTGHSRVLEHNVPTKDAHAVKLLYDAGAVLLGKLATHEFAHGGPSFDLPWPPARNPWNPRHFTAGSSSGSAAAVAAGLCAFSLGTDTGGSVRSPSWLCGIAGLKPTFGLIGRSGVIPFSASCDHVGPMAWTVEDVAILLEALVGHDPGDPGSHDGPVMPFRSRLTGDLSGIRVGVIRNFWEKDLDVSPELAGAVDDALVVMKGLGASIENVQLASLHDYYAVRLMITECELYAMHQDRMREHAHDYGHHFLSRCLPGCLWTAADYITAQRHRARIIESMKPVYEKYDVLITVGAGPAPDLNDHKKLGSADKFLRPGMGTLFSVTGAPALAVCCGYSKNGLPLGMQIAGRPFEDATVLAVGYAYEQATPWRNRRPALKPASSPPPIADISQAPANIIATTAEERRIRELADLAGFRLDDELMGLLLETGPFALQLSARLSRDLPWSQGQAAVFRLDDRGGIPTTI